jgi:hypothetical protein
MSQRDFQLSFNLGRIPEIIIIKKSDEIPEALSDGQTTGYLAADVGSAGDDTKPWVSGQVKLVQESDIAVNAHNHLSVAP